jgi:gamma-glutamyltranspeptidase
MTRKLSAILAVVSLALLLLLAAGAHPPTLAAAQQSGQQGAGQRGAIEQNETDIAAKTWPKEAVSAPKTMVVSDNALADEAGVEILRQGGNAVDAAVAVAFALAVVEPRAGNIGGGGFMLVRLADGRTNFVDYREEAPQKASRELYRKPDGTYDSLGSRQGYRAVAVPGTVAGMALALRTYGTLKLSVVMAPAIRLAEGFTISEKFAISLRDARKRLELFDRSRQIFLNGGNLYKAGDTLRQPELAETLKRPPRWPTPAGSSPCATSLHITRNYASRSLQVMK